MLGKRIKNKNKNIMQRFAPNMTYPLSSNYKAKDRKEKKKREKRSASRTSLTLEIKMPSSLRSVGPAATFFAPPLMLIPSFSVGVFVITNSCPHTHTTKIATHTTKIATLATKIATLATKIATNITKIATCHHNIHLTTKAATHYQDSHTCNQESHKHCQNSHSPP